MNEQDCFAIRRDTCNASQDMTDMLGLSIMPSALQLVAVLANHDIGRCSINTKQAKMLDAKLHDHVTESRQQNGENAAWLTRMKVHCPDFDFV